MDKLTGTLLRSRVRDCESYLDSIENNVIFARRALEEIREAAVSPALRLVSVLINQHCLIVQDI